MSTNGRRTVIALIVAAGLVGVIAACSEGTSLPTAHDTAPPVRSEAQADVVRLFDFLPDNESVGDSDGTVHRIRG